MVEHSTRPVRTFTVGFGDPEHDESADAARVARHLGTEHTVDHLDEPTVLALVPELPEVFGEPFADPSALPSRLVSARARRDVTVCLTGDGGDEGFGGYRRYDLLERVGRPLQLLRPVAPLARRLAPRLPVPARRVAAVAGLSPEDLHRHALRITTAAIIERLTGGGVPRYPPSDAWNLSGPSVRRRAMVTDLVAYLPDQLLVKVDRTAMSVGLETRAPLLDHRVIEFSLQLPDHHLRGKPLLKELLYQRVPRALVDRPKQGFTVPLARWLRGELRPLLHDTLTADRLVEVGIEDRALVADLCRRHDAGEDHSDILWALLMLCLWAATPGARAHGR
jgi:asparagine synthase (glutamine-hydrolysing)